MKEPSMIRYERLGSVHLNVTDLQRSLAFYRDMVGLQPTESRHDGSLRFRCGTDDCSVVLHQAAVPGFRSVGLVLESDHQFDNLHRRLRQQAVPFDELSRAECRRLDYARATRIAEPNSGAAFEFYLPAGPLPDAFLATQAKVLRIGHVVFCTPRYVEMATFMRDVLNFMDSDDVDGIIAFMRPPPSPYHHGIGVGRGPHHGLHHLNLMVSEIDDLGRAMHRFRRNAVPVVFGPGRHVASNSVFLYFLDPDGLTVEYSFGMEEFPEADPRAPRTLPPAPESIDLWGAERDARLAAVGLVHPYKAGTGWLPLEKAVA
jgi:2,3-dihydroxy-p-cumate/2,3-dihydroxybenzoate 3,4-dioxygenase